MNTSKIDAIKKNIDILAECASVLPQAMEFTMLVERFVRTDDEENVPPTEAQLAEAMYALRAAIVKASDAGAEALENDGMSSEVSFSYSQGWNAHREGLDINAGPYIPGTALGMGWARGWNARERRRTRTAPILMNTEGKCCCGATSGVCNCRVHGK